MKEVHQDGKFLVQLNEDITFVFLYFTQNHVPDKRRSCPLQRRDIYLWC